MIDYRSRFYITRSLRCTKIWLLKSMLLTSFALWHWANSHLLVGMRIRARTERALPSLPVERCKQRRSSARPPNSVPLLSLYSISTRSLSTNNVNNSIFFFIFLDYPSSILPPDVGPPLHLQLLSFKLLTSAATQVVSHLLARISVPTAIFV